MTPTRKKHFGSVVAAIAASALGGTIVSSAFSSRSADRLGVNKATTPTVDLKHDRPEETTMVQPAEAGQAVSASIETFDSLVLHSQVPVIVDFHAEWCGPCQVQGDILEGFAAEFRRGRIVKVNVDENMELAQRFQVEALPTLLMFKDGKVAGRHLGVATREQLLAMLAE